MATKFYSDDHVIAPESTKSDVDEDYEFIAKSLDNSIESIKAFFELDKAGKWIHENAFKRVALQLPDFYLRWAFEITKFLEDFTSSKIYILGDSSYRSCCVDKVAAEHANCDALIHFGDACLSATIEGFPILYIFCQFDVNLEKFGVELESDLVKDFLETNGIEKVALLYDSNFAHNSEKLIEQVRKSDKNSIKTCIPCDVMLPENFDANQYDVSLGRVVDKRIKSWTEATLIFVGMESSPLLPIWLMSHVQFTNIIHFSPKESRIKIFASSALIRLKKRLFLIEKLRDANTVGLVVGTLAVAGFRESITRIRQLCVTARKKLYVFSVGKINEAKLSNFAADIDVFILLSCPFGIILNTGEFYKPILSLFEAEIALNSAKSWYSGAGWTSQFGDFLHAEIGQNNDEEVDVSLLSGRIRYKQSEDEVNLLNPENKDMIVYNAGDYFANRSWKGLDDQHRENQETDTKLRQGLEGIASEYSTEKNDR